MQISRREKVMRIYVNIMMQPKEVFKSILVEIWKKNSLLKDDCIGGVSISAMSLELDKITEAWHPLIHKYNKGGDTSVIGSSGNNGSVGVDDSVVTEKAHKLHNYNFKKPTNCSYCGDFLWGLALQGLHCKECGYNCHRKCKKLVARDCGIKGSVRINYRYTNDIILPIHQYRPLLAILLDDNKDAIIAFTSMANVEDKKYAARTMMRLYDASSSHGNNLAVKFLNAINKIEVFSTNDPHTIFRANSIATKSVDAYMHQIATEYLHFVLQSIIDEIFSAMKNCEIDPTRLEKGDDVKANKSNLEGYINSVLNSIFTSANECPSSIRSVFAELRLFVLERFPNDRVIVYTAVSGFMFLRFFNPAILAPKLFGMRDDHPNARVSRTLTLISKTVQSLANLVHFGEKEGYMMTLNSCIDQQTLRMRNFLDLISALPTEDTLDINRQRISRTSTEIILPDITLLDLGGTSTTSMIEKESNSKKIAEKGDAGTTAKRSGFRRSKIKKPRSIITEPIVLEKELAAITRLVLANCPGMVEQDIDDEKKKLLKNLYDVASSIGKLTREETENSGNAYLRSLVQSQGPGSQDSLVTDAASTSVIAVEPGAEQDFEFNVADFNLFAMNDLVTLSDLSILVRVLGFSPTIVQLAEAVRSIGGNEKAGVDFEQFKRIIGVTEAVQPALPVAPDVDAVSEAFFILHSYITRGDNSKKSSPNTFSLTNLKNLLMDLTESIDIDYIFSKAASSDDVGEISLPSFLRSMADTLTACHSNTTTLV